MADKTIKKSFTNKHTNGPKKTNGNIMRTTRLLHNKEDFNLDIKNVYIKVCK